MIEYLSSREFLILFAKMIAIFGGVMGALAYTTLVERRLMAFVQMRPGPNRVGPFGLLQPIADGLKFLFKEQTVPGSANVLLYYAAPILSMIPALLSFSVIPFGPDLKIADIDVSLLLIFAITSLGVYGIVLGGWASNSKYPLMGAMRSSAQMLSYELSLTLSVVGVLMIANTLSLIEPCAEPAGNVVWFHSADGTSSFNRWPSSCTCSAESRKPIAFRSIWPSPSRNWSRAGTRNTAA